MHRRSTHPSFDAAAPTVPSPRAEADPGVLDADLDAAQMELVRARVEQRLFGHAEPARLGRFVLLDRIAAGGMGVVYGAHDPSLDRRVALKVLHPEAARAGSTQQRLLAEARALARLAHPNVVPVHEVVVLDEQVVIVMEWVEGQTLASWERAPGRSWREVVASYVAAGRGLAAAHALGLVHRDFKPANAIVGDDGRVRIFDFGLARRAAAPATPPALAAAPAAALAVGGLTEPGEVPGTLAFMAPEQLRGEVATAASDQFSFCVALFAALFRTRPYRGETATTLLAAMEAEELVEPAADRGVPGWLRAVLARGLAAAPDRRYPSMIAMLAVLERERGWRRARTPIAVVLAAGVAMAAVRLGAHDQAAATCTSGAAEIAAIWGPAQRGAVLAAIDRTGPRLAAQVRRAVLDGLDTYSDRWAAEHRAACLRHRDGAESAAALDRRMICLRRRRDALAAAADALGQLDASSIPRAREVVSRLPAVADCGDLEQLAAEYELPADPAERARVATLEAALARAVTQERLGRTAAALAGVRELLGDAAVRAHPPLLADAHLAEGRILLFQGTHADAREPLARAESVSFEHGLLARGVEAAARRIFVEAMQQSDLPGLLRQSAVLEEVSRPLRDGVARPLLLNNLGVLYMTLERPADARAAFGRARESLGRRVPEPELTAIDRNLAMLEPDPAARERLTRGVWDRRRAQLGDLHPLTLEAQLSHGFYLDDPARSLAEVREACAGYRAYQPEALRARAECSAYQAFLAFEIGDLPAAEAAYLEVAALAASDPRGTMTVRERLAIGGAALCRGDDGAARAAFALALAGSGGGWAGKEAAQAHLGLGLAWRAFPAVDAPIAHLISAIAGHEHLAGLNESPEPRRRLALARATLADLLRRSGGAKQRIAELEQAAAAFYRAAGAEPYRHRLEQLRRDPGTP